MIPEERYEGIKESSKNFRAAATEALEDYLKRKKAQRAIASFGSWEKRRKKSIDIVNKMRREGGHKIAARNIRHYPEKKLRLNLP